MSQFDFASANLRTDASVDSASLSGLLSVIQNDLSEKSWSSDYASFLLPETPEYLEASIAMAAEFSDFDALVIVGIGGSNLGTAAIAEALFGKLAFARLEKTLFFLDTVDTSKVSSVLSVVEAIVSDGGKVGLVTVSKSGSTAETAALSAVAYEFMKKRCGLSASDCVAITEPGSKLSKYAESEGWKSLPMRPKVGGRYSVLSNVGLFPLAFLGVDVEELLEGAAAGIADSCGEDAATNPAFLGAKYLFEGSAEGRNVVDHFFFTDAFESVGKWYRQLLGESVGKELKKDGSRANAGLTPTTSIGSTDLHSVGQLYLGGPRDKSFTFVRAVPIEELRVPGDAALDAVVPHIAGKPLQAIMDAIYQGTAEAYRTKGIPFAQWELQEGSAYDLGYFLQVKMCEVAYLGMMFGVDPFDQPNVEDYKVGTKRVLAEGR